MGRMTVDELGRVDLRRYLDRTKRFSAFFTSKPIWLDLQARSVWLCDDDEIAAAIRALEAHGYTVTTRWHEGGWMVEWTEETA